MQPETNQANQWWVSKETKTKSNSFYKAKTKDKINNSWINNFKIMFLVDHKRKHSKMLWKVTHKLDWTKWAILYNNSLTNKTKVKSKSKSLPKSQDRASCSSNSRLESKAIINQTFPPNLQDKAFNRCSQAVMPSSQKPNLSSRWCSSSSNKNLKIVVRIQETNQTPIKLVLTNWINQDNKSSRTNNLPNK